MKKNKIIIIAEAGVNYNGKVSIAKRLIAAAKKNGADYIKFQMFRTSDHITKKAKQAHYQIRNLKKNQISLRWLRNWNLVKNNLKKFIIFQEKRILSF